MIDPSGAIREIAAVYLATIIVFGAFAGAVTAITGDWAPILGTGIGALLCPPFIAGVFGLAKLLLRLFGGEP